MQGLADNPHHRPEDAPSPEAQEIYVADQLRKFTFAARSRQMCHSSMYPHPGFSDTPLWEVFSRNIAEQSRNMVELAAAMLAKAGSAEEKAAVHTQLEQIIESAAGGRDAEFLADFWGAVGARKEA